MLLHVSLRKRCITTGYIIVCVQQSCRIKTWTTLQLYPENDVQKPELCHCTGSRAYMCKLDDGRVADAMMTTVHWVHSGDQRSNHYNCCVCAIAISRQPRGPRHVRLHTNHGKLFTPSRSSHIMVVSILHSLGFIFNNNLISGLIIISVVICFYLHGLTSFYCIVMYSEFIFCLVHVDHWP